MKLIAKPREHLIDVLFSLALFCVFAVSALAVVIMGADVYAGITENMDRNFTTRTSVAYLSEKIRQNDTSGGVSIGEMDGGTALVLEQSYDGVAYQTWIYLHDGSLMELFIRKGSAFSPENGNAIMELRAFSAELDGKLCSFTVTGAGGHTAGASVALRSSQDRLT